VPLSKRLIAELIGTFWLVLGGCGSAVLAANFAGPVHGLGIGFVGVSLAFGLTVLTMAFAIGHISGCHLNPAVSVGLTVAGRFPARDLLPYIAAQVVGAVIGTFVLALIATGNPAFDLAASGFATNGYGEHSPGHYAMGAAFVCEVVMTAFFLFVILGATDKRAPTSFAPIAIGLCLTLIHLISIPIPRHQYLVDILLPLSLTLAGRRPGRGGFLLWLIQSQALPDVPGLVCLLPCGLATDTSRLEAQVICE